MFHLIEKVSAKNLGEIIKEMNFTVSNSPVQANKDHDWGTILTFVTRVMEIALDFAAITAGIMMMMGAIGYAMSFGDEAKAETAKKQLLWSIIGLFILAGSRLVIGFISRELTGKALP
ncbi:MAG: hypothetical protein WC107_00045 [Patescibacteria group bacterium]